MPIIKLIIGVQMVSKIEPLILRRLKKAQEKKYDILWREWNINDGAVILLIN